MHRSNDHLIDKLLVHPETPIIDALERLNAAHRRIVLVSGDDRHLLGVVIDSDIRRAVLAHVAFDQPVSTIMVRNPVVARPDMSATDISDLMRRTDCYQIPVVDETGQIVDIWFVDELFKEDAPTALRPKSIHVDTAVIMAGGLGTRLSPLTDDMPKTLLEVGGQPILFTIVDQLLDSGLTRIYLTVNHLADQIREAVNRVEHLREAITFVQENERLGTAGALSLLPEPLEATFLVMNGDLLTSIAIEEMIDFHAADSNVITMALKSESVEIPYGVVDLEGTQVVGFREKPKMTYFINAGVYVAEPEILEHLPKGERYDMPELINDLLAKKQRVGCFPVHEYWLDIGRPEQLERAHKEFPTVFAQEVKQHS